MLLCSEQRLKASASKTVYLIMNKSGKNFNNKIDLYMYNANIPQDEPPTHKKAQVNNKSTMFSNHTNFDLINNSRTRIPGSLNPKILGITLDPSLNFKKHLETIQQRASKRHNMMRSIKGKNWGASSKLLLITYKSLIRPLTEYCAFITLTLGSTYNNQLELIQRKCVRTAIYWQPGIAAEEIYQQKKLSSIKTRASQLTTMYLNKTIWLNPLIKESIYNYNKSSDIINFIGAKSKNSGKKNQHLSSLSTNYVTPITSNHSFITETAAPIFN